VFFAFEGSYSTIPGRPSVRAVLVAAVASELVTQLFLGDEPIFRLPAYEVRSPLELPLYLGLGLVASLMSWALVSLLSAGRSGPVQRSLARLPAWMLTALGGLGVGLMALGFPQVLGVGYDTIEALLGSDGGIALATLLGLLGVKLLATGLSSATGFVGGGFAPSLFLGAVLGNVYGQILGDSGFHLPVAEPPAYAMVGMAAVLAGSAPASVRLWWSAGRAWPILGCWVQIRWKRSGAISWRPCPWPKPSSPRPRWCSMGPHPPVRP
jgi:H+/Cl- antiporter ClcA